MTDSRLQELKRAWEASGSVEDEATYLRERIRVGDLTQERLELAAYCGHEGARTVLGQGEHGQDWEGWVRGLASRWGRQWVLTAFLGAYRDVSLPLLAAEADLVQAGVVSKGEKLVRQLELYLKCSIEPEDPETLFRMLLQVPDIQLLALPGDKDALAAASRRSVLNASGV